MEIKTFAQEVHKNAKDHGWWSESRSFGDLIALVHSEASEAFEEIRSGHKPTEMYYSGEERKPEGVPSELADIVIRVFDMCEHYGIDIETILKEKHEFNKTRPWKHGGKVL